MGIETLLSDNIRTHTLNSSESFLNSGYEYQYLGLFTIHLIMRYLQPKPEKNPYGNSRRPEVQ